MDSNVRMDSNVVQKYEVTAEHFIISLMFFSFLTPISYVKVKSVLQSVDVNPDGFTPGGFPMFTDSPRKPVQCVKIRSV